MRFVLDEDVDAQAVGSFLRNRGHDCWSVVDAGLGGADDAVATYADDRDALLVTHDAASTHRRRRFTFGRHVFLRCHQLEATDLLDHYLEDLVENLARHPMGVFVVRSDRLEYHAPRYEPD